MKKMRYRVGPGAASLLLIVVVLCLAVLGILTWTSARADLRLSQRDWEMVCSYYYADAGAQEMLSRVDEALARARLGAENWEDYLARVDEALPEGVSREGSQIVYSQEAGADRSLNVRLELTDLAEARRYLIGSWTLIDGMDWEEDW